MKKNYAAVDVAGIALVAVIGGLLLSKFNIWIVLCDAIVVMGLCGCALALARNKDYLRVQWKNQPGRPNAMFALYAAALLGVTMILGCYTAWNMGMGRLPSVIVYAGYAILLGGLLLLLQCYLAIPPHAAELYGGQPQNAKEGPYSVIRHPEELAGCIIAIGLPLALCSAWAFAPAGIAIALLIANAKMEDDYRFNHYTWFNDYTHRVPFRMIPFTW